MDVGVRFLSRVDPVTEGLAHQPILRAVRESKVRYGFGSYIDQSLPGLPLSEPVRLVFEQGRVTRIEGGAGADHLRQLIAAGESKPNSEWSRVVGELGIGTNPKARLQGNLMTDEKVMGTIHIAIGHNTFFGGQNPAPIHEDGVVGQPTMRVDGELLIDQGRYVLNR